MKHGLEGAGVLALDATGLAAFERAAASRAAEAGIDVAFGHGARHLAGTDLVQGEVEAAIENEVVGQVSGASADGWFSGRVSVGGQIIEYRAYALPDGTVNIGTYYVVP